MELSFGKKKGAPPPPPAHLGNDNHNDQVMGNDRLQKAIQRNRAKQEKREDQDVRGMDRQPPPAGRPNSRFAYDREPAARPNPRRNQDYPRAGQRNLPRDIIQDNPTMETRRPNRSYTPSHAQPGGRRAGVSRPLPGNNYQEPSEGFRPRRAAAGGLSKVRSRIGEPGGFVDKLKKKASAPIERFLDSPKWNKANQKFIEWGLKVGWGICIVLIARLFVTERGIIDYYSQQELLNDKNTNLRGIQKENMLILKEIESIKNNTKFQKKLVRSHLGHISADEFLILFPKNKK